MLQAGDRVRVADTGHRDHGRQGVVVASLGWLGEPESYSVDLDFDPAQDTIFGQPVQGGGLFREAQLELVQPAVQVVS